MILLFILLVHCGMVACIAQGSRLRSWWKFLVIFVEFHIIMFHPDRDGFPFKSGSSQGFLLVLSQWIFSLSLSPRVFLLRDTFKLYNLYADLFYISVKRLCENVHWSKCPRFWRFHYVYAFRSKNVSYHTLTRIVVCPVMERCTIQSVFLSKLKIHHNTGEDKVVTQDKRQILQYATYWTGVLILKTFCPRHLINQLILLYFYLLLSTTCKQFLILSLWGPSNDMPKLKSNLKL